ncbi:MAG: hypothetical protein V4481_03300 [Patescibacteria group bacterium]
MRLRVNVSKSVGVALRGAQLMFKKMTPDCEELCIVDFRATELSAVERERTFQMDCVLCAHYSNGTTKFLYGNADVTVAFLEGEVCLATGTGKHSAYFESSRVKQHYYWAVPGMPNLFAEPVQEVSASAKKKILVVSVKYTVVEDGSEKIIELLADGGRCESELVKCLGSCKLDSLHTRIKSGDFYAVLIVWESLFDVNQLQEFVRLVHAKFPKLHLVVVSGVSSYRELLKNAGCSAEVDTDIDPELHSKHIHRAIGL